jgi:hypothetical protein
MSAGIAFVSSNPSGSYLEGKNKQTGVKVRREKREYVLIPKLHGMTL